VRVKICGITQPEDAALACDLGADLLGINFWPRSPRAVSPAQAREVADAACGRALLVGVFVNEGPARIAEAVAAAKLDLVQLHGDEEPEMLRELAREGVAAGKTIRALRVGAAFDAGRETAPWETTWGWLFDAARPGMYGGTGAEWPWRRIAGAVERAPGLAAGRTMRRVLVAGGIAPGRLRSLLAAAGDWRPWGIDVCSGVERSPGRKDPAKLRALFEEVGTMAAPGATGGRSPMDDRREGMG
jgi:phosphoribosylanthranilate isomerase